jgi:hypothetical protein
MCRGHVARILRKRMEMSEQESAKPLQAGSFKDARGKPVTLLDPYELNMLRRYDVIPADTLQRIADKVGFGLPKWQRLGYFACVFTFFACVVFLVIWKFIRRSGVDAVERVLWPVNLAVFALGAVQFWRSGRRARAKRVCEVMLAHLRCPHCGYDIRGLPFAPEDHATVCPECGSAWRVASLNASIKEPHRHLAETHDGEAQGPGTK